MSVWKSAFLPACGNAAGLLRPTTDLMRRTLPASAIVLVLAGVVAAENVTGRVVGSVASRDGARLPGAVITISGAAGGATTRLTSSGLGTWRSPELAPGRYEVQAALPGFESRRLTVVLAAGEEKHVELQLDLASLQERVSVIGSVPRATLEASELREMSAYDLGEALGKKAGLWRLRKGAIANDVVLRGLQSRDLNVLIDGQRIYGACPNHMDPAAFHVDFAEVARVEVARGPFDVKNQGGLGGTVNVVTRKPLPGWHGSAQLSAASFGAIFPSVTVARGGSRLSALAGYSYRESGAYEDGDGRKFTTLANYRPAVQERRAFSAGTAWGRVLWKPAAHHLLDLSYTRQDAGRTFYPYLLMDAIWDDADRVNLRYEATDLGARRASVRAQGYFTQVDHWMTDENRVSSEAKPRAYSMGTQADTQTAGGKAEAVLGALTLGVESYERRWNASNEMAGSAYALQAMVPGVATLVGGAFAEYEKALRPGLAIAAGARLDQAHTTADANIANAVLYEAYQGTRSLSANDTLPAGKLRLAWRSGGWELSGGVGHASRSPEAIERYLALRRMGTDWVGNPALTPSRNTGLEAGVAFERAGYRAELSAYNQRIDDFITVYDQPRRAMVPGVMNAVARSFANVDARLRGLELVASLPVLFERVFLAGDVSYVRGTQEGDATRGIDAGDLAEMPPLRGRLSARYDDGRFHARLEGVFAAEQDHVDTALREELTPGWGIANVSAGVRAGRLRATAGVNNLFDRLYVEHLSYQRDPFRSGTHVPEPGRSLYLNVSAGF
jgi:iron complex outermembrane recepter protein